MFCECVLFVIGSFTVYSYVKDFICISIMRYAYAIPFYKRHLATHADDVDALNELGYCYKINNQCKKFRNNKKNSN